VGEAGFDFSPGYDIAPPQQSARLHVEMRATSRLWTIKIGTLIMRRDTIETVKQASGLNEQR
jgi:hypothetical protein